VKFAKGQKVMITPLHLRGEIVHGFPVKRYAEPDFYHYVVKSQDGREENYEVREEDLT